MTLAATETLTAAPPPPTSTTPGAATLIGRGRERERIAGFLTAARHRGGGALVLVGEAGMGKSALLRWAAEEAGARGFRLRWGDVDDDASAGATGPTPTLLLLDDVEPATDLGRELVTTRAPTSAGGVAVIAAIRGWVPGAPALGATIAGADHLDLAPLGLDDLRELVLQRTGAAVSRPTLRRLHERSGGNPLVALDLLRSWRAGTASVAACSPLGAVVDRLRTLDDGVVVCARVVALAGRLSLGDLERACPVGDTPRAVRAAAAAGLVVVGDDLVARPAHPIVATAVLQDIDWSERRAIHLGLAAALSDPESACRHRAHGAAEPDGELAEDLDDAADRAARRGRTDDAARLRALSVRLTPLDDAGARARRILAEADDIAASGRTVAALARVDAALDELGDTEHRMRAVTRRALIDFTGSDDLLSSALATDCPPAERARLLDMAGWQLGTYRGRPDAGAEHAAEALTLARAAGDVEVTMLAATTLATVSLLRGCPQPELMDEAVATGRRTDLSRLGRWPDVFRARHRLWNGELERARHDFRQAMTRARDIGSEFQVPYRLYDLAMVELAYGNVATARQLATTGCDRAHDAANDHVVTWLSYPLGLAAAHGGDGDTAERCAERLAWWAHHHDEPPRDVMADEVRATVAAAGGDWDTALRRLDHGVTTLRRLGYRHPGVIPVLPRAVEAAAAAADGARLQAYAWELDGQRPPLAAPWVDSQAAAGRGLLAVHDGDAAAGLDLLAAAAHDLERLGYHLDAIRIRMSQARASCALGRAGAARAMYGDALVELRDLDADGWTATCRDALDHAANGLPPGLTPTQQHIVLLVAAGRRNREIAAATFVSESTVEAHLTRIYRKVGVRSRTELARVVGPAS